MGLQPWKKGASNRAFAIALMYNVETKFVLPVSSCPCDGDWFRSSQY